MTTPSVDELLRRAEGRAEKPELVVNNRHLGDVADELVRHLEATNDPPTLFAHAEGASELDDRRLRPLNTDGLLDVTEQRTSPVTIDKNGNVRPSRVAVDIRKITLRRLTDRLPELIGLAPAPFMRPNGTIATTPGYDPATQLYLLDGAGVEVPDEPSDTELAAAVALVDELLGDFPFAGDADRAHAFSLAITPAIRHLVPLAPLHYVNANNAGVGKNLLVETVTAIHTGERLETHPLPTDEEEMRKQITAHLAEGRRFVMWDEAHYLIGRQLARLLTSARWSDRYLGSNTTIVAHNMMTTAALGNNGEIVGDLRRRVVRINMESPLVDPSSRTGFRHADLRLWAERNRAGLLSAILTMLRAWHVRGRPAGPTIGSFENWSRIVGGTLAVAGVDGFLGNRAELLEEADWRDAEFATHLHELHEVYGADHFAVRDVLSKYRDILYARHHDLPSGIRPDREDAGQKLGRLYRTYRDRVMPGGLRLVRVGMAHRGVATWTVDREGRGGDGGDGGDGLPFTRGCWSLSVSSDDDARADRARHPHADPGASPPSPPSPPRRCSTCAGPVDEVGCCRDETCEGRAVLMPGRPHRPPKLDPAPLVAAGAARGRSLRQTAELLGVDPAVLCRPITIHQADRFAARLGHHATELWGYEAFWGDEGAWT